MLPKKIPNIIAQSLFQLWLKNTFFPPRAIPASLEQSQEEGEGGFLEARIFCRALEVGHWVFGETLGFGMAWLWQCAQQLLGVGERTVLCLGPGPRHRGPALRCSPPSVGEANHASDPGGQNPALSRPRRTGRRGCPGRRGPC